MPGVRLTRLILAAVLVALVSGCSLLGPWGPPRNAPTLPAEQFPALADREPDVHTSVESLAADGSDVVAIAQVNGRVDLASFWWSSDAGVTWQEGRLSDEAADATQIGESVWGFAAVSVREGGRLWLGLGAKGDDRIAWTSTDGQTWDRQLMTGLDPRRASVGEVVGTPDGFLAVGSLWNEVEQTTAPAVWRSADGITWEAQLLEGEGWLADIAVHDGTMVAVGSHGFDAMTAEGRVREPLLFVSTDAGGTWARQAVPEPAYSGEFVTSLTHVIWTPDGYVAGGQLFSGERGSYRAWTLESADAVSWSPGDVPELTSDQGVVGLAQTESGTFLVATGVQQNTTQIQLFSRSAPGVWERRVTPEVVGERWVNDTLGVGGALLLSVGVSDRIVDEVLWRTDDLAATAWTQFRIPVPEASGARTEPAALLLRDGVLTAWGNVQGATGVWTRGEDGTFGEPRIVRDEPRESFGGIHAGEPGLLMLGSRAGEAQVLFSADGETWEESGPGTFNRVAQYHSSEVSDATWAGDRWIVVGTRSTNGDVRQHALISSSARGASWTPGAGTSVLARGDSFSEDDAATDLEGLENMGRSIGAVATTPSGLLAVGHTTSVDGDRPALWRSDDKATWTLTTLPSEGAAAATAHSVRVEGDRVVVIGYARSTGSTDWAPIVWTSHDGGATFSQGTLGDQGRSGATLLTSSPDHGFVVTVGAWDGGVPTVWRSADGVAWTAEPVTVPNAADGVEAGVQTALIEGDTLHLLMYVTNRLDSVPVIVDVPLA